MRRARFARAVERATATPERASISEALWFDIKTPDSTDDDSLLAWRIASIEHSAVLLGISHLVAGGAFAALHAQAGSAGLLAMGLPLALVLLLDVVAGLALYFRDRLGLKPHMMVRALCVYLAAVGVLWMFVAAGGAGQAPPQGEATSLLLIGAGAMMATVLSINSPALALVNTATAAFGSVLLARSPSVVAATRCCPR